LGIRSPTGLEDLSKLNITEGVSRNKFSGVYGAATKTYVNQSAIIPATTHHEGINGPSKRICHVKKDSIIGSGTRMIPVKNQETMQKAVNTHTFNMKKRVELIQKNSQR